MAQRASWGSNAPARRKGYRVLRYWADTGDGRGYMRHTMTVKGGKRAGDSVLRDLWSRYKDCARSVTVREAYERWFLPDMQRKLDSYLANPRPGRRGELVKPGTFDQTLSTWRKHVEPRWGDVPVADVGYADIQDWINGKTAQPAIRSLSLLRGILRFALMADEVDRNVATFDYVMPTASTIRGSDIWTLDELVNEVWPAVHGRICEPAFILSAFDSCRTGEALAPRLDEITECRVDGMMLACVPLLRQVSNRGKISVEGDLKNEWSPRSTVLPEPWSARVLQLRDRALARGETWLSDNGLGEPIGQVVMRRDFRNALTSAGVEPKQFRALRRSWRSWIAGMGISSEILEKMMGHVGDGTTGRHYLRLTEDLIKKEIARAFTERPIKIAWDILGDK